MSWLIPFVVGLFCGGMAGAMLVALLAMAGDEEK